MIVWSSRSVSVSSVCTAIERLPNGSSGHTRNIGRSLYRNSYKRAGCTHAAPCTPLRSRRLAPENSPFSVRKFGNGETLKEPIPERSKREENTQFPDWRIFILYITSCFILFPRKRMVSFVPFVLCERKKANYPGLQKCDLNLFSISRR